MTAADIAVLIERERVACLPGREFVITAELHFAAMNSLKRSECGSKAVECLSFPPACRAGTVVRFRLVRYRD
jgi:hypothetical protein